MTGQSKDIGPEILPTQDWELLLDIPRPQGRGATYWDRYLPMSPSESLGNSLVKGNSKDKVTEKDSVLALPSKVC